MLKITIIIIVLYSYIFVIDQYFFCLVKNNLKLSIDLQHIMLAFRCALSCLIPDVPQWIATEMAKAEYIRREAASSKSP